MNICIYTCIFLFDEFMHQIYKESFNNINTTDDRNGR